MNWHTRSNLDTIEAYNYMAWRNLVTFMFFLPVVYVDTYYRELNRLAK